MSTLDDRFRRAHRELRTVAVTGTNGKTTTSSMIAAIVAGGGEPDARVTNAGAWVEGERIEGGNPTEVFLHAVERAVASGVRTLALEMTSRALGRGMAKHWPPQAAVFTNLSRDHMETHGSPEAYLASKAQLFMALPAGGVAVLNGDDPASDLLQEVIPQGIEVRRFSVRDESAELAAVEVEPSRTGTRVALRDSPLAVALGGVLELTAVGAVHAQNALAAALAGDALGYSSDAIRSGLLSFRGVPGRFEIVVDRPLVIVDYAHTPAGLIGTLDTARALVEEGGRLVCVFGCAGNRDRGKRPMMGAVVHQRADLALLTNDNPRREKPATIAADISAGVEGRGAEWLVELDRRRAILWACDFAQSTDVVVIAGKGHEDQQEIGSRRVPFSDAKVAAEIWRGSRAVCGERCDRR